MRAKQARSLASETLRRTHVEKFYQTNGGKRRDRDRKRTV